MARWFDLAVDGGSSLYPTGLKGCCSCRRTANQRLDASTHPCIKRVMRDAACRDVG
ncbi:hypothetical protein [Bradyrhizobium sp. 191]|uniref:hypothetical protein n=1 Tax=Bradyrhizobium sp. 191 TaxID=2782659 RepID=UPI001FFFEA0B|nr:hypothetical protein [Bradyrhizobium sp. 191]